MMKMFPTWREKYLRGPGSAVTAAHIPARLGSSRIKRKNVRELGGLPLTAYSILQARAVKGIDLVYVNTESGEIAEIAREYGAEVPFMRPRHLAGTDTPMHEAIQFFYDRLRDGPMVVSKVITLYPTSPFRNVNRLGQIVASLDSSVFVHTAMKANADRGFAQRVIEPGCYDFGVAIHALYN